MLVDGCCTDPKMAVWCSCARFLCILIPKAMLRPPPPPPVKVFDLNQSFQCSIYTLDLGSTYLVASKWATKP